MTLSSQERTTEKPADVEDSVAEEVGEVVVEGEEDRSRLTQHPGVAAEVEMKPTKPGPDLGAGTEWGQVEEEEGEPAV